MSNPASQSAINARNDEARCYRSRIVSPRPQLKQFFGYWQLPSINPGVNLVVVRVIDIAGNVSLTKMHVNDSLALPPPNSLQITPSQVNLVVGDSRQFNVVDELGHPRTDVTWTVSDSSIATITSVSSPVLTAVSPGGVTLNATVQGLASSLRLNIGNVALSAGTASWISRAPGYGSLATFQAVPTGDGGPALYSLGGAGGPNGISYAIEGFSSDGQLFWQQPIPQISTIPIPDDQGGMVVQTFQGSSTNTLTDLDDLTGSPVWQNSSENGFTNFAVRPDGGYCYVGINSGRATDKWANVARCFRWEDGSKDCSVPPT